MEKIPYVIILVTTSSKEEAEKIGETIVKEKLAASANIIPSIRSFFFWKTKFYDINEALVIFNTRAELWERVKTRITALHSYELPEIIALPIIAGSDKFFNWIEENTLSPSSVSFIPRDKKETGEDRG